MDQSPKIAEFGLVTFPGPLYACFYSSVASTHVTKQLGGLGIWLFLVRFGCWVVVPCLWSVHLVNLLGIKNNNNNKQEEVAINRTNFCQMAQNFFLLGYRNV